MRCSPLALASWSNLDQVLDWSDQDASITHPHPICLQANRAFLRALVAGLRGADPDQMYQAALSGAQGQVLEALEKARLQPPSDFVHHMGWVLLALQNAFYRLLHASSLEEGVVDTVRAGGDTDTNGCIAGALLGAAYGIRAIPEQWRLAVLCCRPHPDFAASRQRRPSFCWPVDAYQITERLLNL
jgi:ADP-ribosylglycohydrolase